MTFSYIHIRYIYHFHFLLTSCPPSHAWRAPSSSPLVPVNFHVFFMWPNEFIREASISMDERVLQEQGHLTCDYIAKKKSHFPPATINWGSRSSYLCEFKASLDYTVMSKSTKGDILLVDSLSVVYLGFIGTEELFRPLPPYLIDFSRLLSLTASYAVVSMFTLVCALCIPFPLSGVCLIADSTGWLFRYRDLLGAIKWKLIA